MPPHEQTLQQLLAASRLQHTRYALWLKQLRDDDPDFAHASVRYPNDANEWQAATYLLSGCPPVWSAFGDLVLAEVSIAPIIFELDEPSRPWSTSEQAVLEWAAHFWDVGHSDVRFPHVFDSHNFRRWITACHLYRRTMPEVPFTGGAT